MRLDNMDMRMTRLPTLLLITTVQGVSWEPTSVGFALTAITGIADPGAVELTDDEVVSLIEKLGFDIEKRESGITTPYIQDPESMLQNTFKASHWIARKR
jgi:hypothetical protein